MILSEEYSSMITKWRTGLHAAAKEVSRDRKLPEWFCLARFRSGYSPSDSIPDFWNGCFSVKKRIEYLDWCVDFTVRLLEGFYQYITLANNSESVMGGNNLRHFSRKWFSDHLQKWSIWAFIGLLPKVLKYHTCALLAGAMKNELPEKPDLPINFGKPGELFAGPVGARLRLCAFVRYRGDRCKDVGLLLPKSLPSSPTDDYMSFFYGLAEVKKVSIPIHSEWVDAEVASTFVDLTTTKESSDPSALDLVLIEAEKICKKLCARAGPYFRKNKVLPATAGHTMGRKDDGNYGWFVNQTNGSRSSRTLVEYHYMVRMIEHKGRVSTVYGRGLPDYDQELLWLQKSSEIDWDVPCDLVGLPEPFKVRVISKGEECAYSFSRSFQAYFWSLLRQSPVFALTGQPIAEFHINRLISGNPFKGNCCMMVSGDYKAATNNLNPELSRHILRSICRFSGIPAEDEIRLAGALVGHKILDPRNPESGYHAQRWGQLMGSPLSFVILCIANAAATILAQKMCTGPHQTPEDWLPKPGAEYCSLLVNGDDVLFPIPPGGYSDWCRLVTASGLQPSVGKNFTSNRYCTVNSEIISLPIDWDTRSVLYPKILPSLKVHLMFPNFGDTLLEDPTDNEFRRSSLQMRLSRLLKGSKNPHGLMSKALAFHARVLKRVPHTISWWVARSHGGLGLPITQSDVIRESHRLRVAMRYMEMPDYSELHPYTFGAAKLSNSLLQGIVEAQVFDELEVPWERGTYGPLPDSLEIVDPKDFIVPLTEFEALALDRYLQAWSRWIQVERKLAYKRCKVLTPATESTCSLELIPWVRRITKTGAREMVPGPEMEQPSNGREGLAEDDALSDFQNQIDVGVHYCNRSLQNFASGGVLSYPLIDLSFEDQIIGPLINPEYP